MMFPENDMIGIDYIIPDFDYVTQRADKVKAIIITHGHEDHIGAIPHLLESVNAPIYGTPLTVGLIKNKISRRKLGLEPKLNTVNAGETVQIGPFKVDFFHVSHSIPDAVGLGIDTPAGLVVHTGDYKLDHTPVDNFPTDYAKLAQFAQRGVLALLADSTNAVVPGWTPSEAVINQAIDQVFQNAKGRILVATFASLISRITQVYEAAVKHKRKIAFVGLSMTENIKIAQELGYVDFDEKVVIPLDVALQMPPSQVVLMITGSQGEPLSILGKLANGTNKRFNIQAGDTVVLSSHPIPGNEEPVYRAINKLMAQGADVIYGAIAPVHVSGHASQEEMKLMLHLLRPRYLIPAHGELRMLKQHAQLAMSLGMEPEQIAVVENGRMIEFTHGEMKLGERIPGGYVFVDGSGVGDVDRSTMREREQLAADGVVLMKVVLSAKNGAFQDATFTSRGFMSNEDSQELYAEIKRRTQKLVQFPGNNLQRDIENMVKGLIYEDTRRQPVIFVTMTKE